MCEESGAADEEVWKIVRELVPDWEDGTWRAPDVDGEHQLDKWLVLACAVYLVGWESPSGCVCHAVRAPGSKVTLAPASRFLMSISAPPRCFGPARCSPSV
jgi:hypothetical protein